MEIYRVSHVKQDANHVLRVFPTVKFAIKIFKMTEMAHATLNLATVPLHNT